MRIEFPKAFYPRAPAPERSLVHSGGTAYSTISVDYAVPTNPILTDLNLPDMNVVEAITILKKIPITSRIPIVVLNRRDCSSMEKSTPSGGSGVST
jgi:response regulator RpfG family c-di-GMP phosphodiesterase